MLPSLKPAARSWRRGGSCADENGAGKIFRRDKEKQNDVLWLRTGVKERIPVKKKKCDGEHDAGKGDFRIEEEPRGLIKKIE